MAGMMALAWDAARAASRRPDARPIAVPPRRRRGLDMIEFADPSPKCIRS